MSANKDDLKARLSDEQYSVTQNGGTERPFTGQYVDNKDNGTYACVCCGNELFSSEHKFDSGSGWPSFWLPLAGDNVRTIRDTSHGMIRSGSENEASCGVGKTQVDCFVSFGDEVVEDGDVKGPGGASETARWEGESDR